MSDLHYNISDTRQHAFPIENTRVQIFLDIFMFFLVSYLCKLKRGSLYYLTMVLQAVALQATRTIC